MSKLSRPTSVRAGLALSCVGTMLLPLAATTAHAQEEGKSLGGMTVTDTAITEQPGRKQASPKSVRPVRDTPQTVTILSKEVLEQQNLISLRDALSTVPGISFGAGEGGSGYGDKITLRGYSADNDITIDGIRDSAQYSRTDDFNIEQIEVTNGASSVQNGSGSVGGNINLVSKRPVDHDQAIFKAGIGTDNYYRTTADINYHLTDNIAFRLNAMYHHNDPPGRQVEQNDRWAVAPAITFGIGGPTQLTVQYLHQHDVNIPVFGVPFFSTTNFEGTGTNFVGPLPDVDRTAYYGYRNLDTQRIGIDQVNLVFDHAFSDKVSLRNYFRYQDVTQFSITDGPEGVFCIPKDGAGITVSGTACTVTINSVVVPVAPGTFVPSGGSRGNVRATRNQIAFNQTDLKAVVNTGGIEHTLDLGVSVSREVYHAKTGNIQRTESGVAANVLVPNPVIPYDNLNPNNANTYTGPENFIVGGTPRARIENYAVYLFDAMKLSDHFELNGGVRLERNEGQSQTTTYVTTPGATFGQISPTNVATTVYNKDTLFSYRAAFVYKPSETSTFYIAYGNSKTPSQTTVNSAGSCTIAGVGTATTSTCSNRPEGAKNYEIGAKGELFDGALLLTAALFRNDRDSYKVLSNIPGVPNQQNDGHSRVDGISLGASGHITPKWSITGNYTYLKSKLIQSVSDFCLAHPGTPATNPTDTTPRSCTNSVAIPNPGGGSELVGVPKHSGSIYTSYFFPFGLTIGYGATYQGSFAINSPSTTALPTAANQTVFRSQSYLIHNATINYDINSAFSAQINVKNIGDKLYYTSIRSGNGWAAPGEGRSAVLTLTYKM